MTEQHDFALLLRSHTPIMALETHEERRAVKLLKQVTDELDLPIFKWSITDGMQRLDLNLDAQSHLKDPKKVLQHIKIADYEAVYLLLDYHPYLTDPVHVRLLKETAMQFDNSRSKLVLISHRIETPSEIERMTVNIHLQLPGEKEIRQLINDEARRFQQGNRGIRVKTDSKTLGQLVQNLAGLTFNDAKQLIRTAIIDDGAITDSDLPEVMEAKYKLLNRDNTLAYEFDTAQFSELGGMSKLKNWLLQRHKVFQGELKATGLNPPKGILLLGVQGCGKSLAAKAVAGVWKVPLLRLDFGRLYNKYIGETERNLREALHTAEVMAPCVLWIDEIEKGLATGQGDDGTSQRVLGSLLTWMAENKRPVFLVATANNIEYLPPELIRKGRMDEVFFVDLPDTSMRRDIFSIHCEKRSIDSGQLDIDRLAQASEGFSGAEIEQAVVSALYTSHNGDGRMTTDHILEELAATRPLSVLMAEKISALRDWARERTVSVD